MSNNHSYYFPLGHISFNYFARTQFVVLLAFFSGLATMQFIPFAVFFSKIALSNLIQRALIAFMFLKCMLIFSGFRCALLADLEAWSGHFIKIGEDYLPCKSMLVEHCSLYSVHCNNITCDFPKVCQSWLLLSNFFSSVCTVQA